MSSLAAAARSEGGAKEKIEDGDDERKVIRQLVGSEAVITDTAEILSMKLGHSPATRFNLRLQFRGDEYPTTPCLVELTSAVFPLPLVRKLLRLANDTASKHASKGEPHALATVKAVHSFVEGNLFCSCWRELRQVMQLVEAKGGQIKADESTGVVTIRAVQRNYRATLRLTVYPDYPSGGVGVELVGGSTRSAGKVSSTTSSSNSGTKHNFPEAIAELFLVQAKELSRRCAQGFPAEMALKASNPIAAPPPIRSDEGPNSSGNGSKLSASTMRELKHDVAVLKKVSDLKDVQTARDKRNQSDLHSTQVKKDARKELRRLGADEIAKDVARDQKQKMEAAAQAEAQALALAGKQVSDQGDGVLAQPSLLAVADFLIVKFAAGLAHEPCQACGELILPDDPKDCESFSKQFPSAASATAHGRATRSSDVAKKKGSKGGERTNDDPASAAAAAAAYARRPLRVFCGHWFHYDCLDTWMRSPPFVRQCPACSDPPRRIWHPDWPADVRVLERAWSNKQEAARQLEDVKDFFGDVGGGGGGGACDDDFGAFA